MKQSELRGWQKVFSFTFIQNYKSKAAIIGLIVVCLMIMFAGPVISLAAGSRLADKVSELGDCKIENFYIKNDTKFELDTEEFVKQNPQYGKINYILTDESSEAVQEKLGENSLRDVFLYLHLNDEKYYLSFFKSKDSEIASLDITTVSECFEEYFFGIRMAQSGLSEDASALINADRSSSVIDFSEISDNGKDDNRNSFTMIAVTIYAMVVMMIVLVSSQQISVSLVQEKSSKVIETLLLTVRPLAIIVGKITGTMAVLVCNAVLFIICGTVSGIITSVITAKQFSEVITDGMAAMAEAEFGTPADLSVISDITINPFRIVFGIFAVLFTTMLAYVMYAVISGINGASCSSMDDLQSASMFISLSTVIGVYLVMGAVIAEKPVLTRIAYIFPFSGIYMVPVEFIMGRASVTDLLIIWAELAVITAFLFRFAAKIYHVLIYHNGERLKLKNLLEISKAQKGRG